MEELCDIFISFKLEDKYNIDKILKIQKWFRGYIIRLKRLPLILYKIKKYMEENIIVSSTLINDGRLNSSIDEETIINKLIENFSSKIKKPNIRHWYDILVFDNYYGWIPVNIKSTTTKTSDNIGNFSCCVYSYTEEKLDFNKKYNNGDLSRILIDKLNKKKYNKINKKDYYFLVINKDNPKDIIINSIKGLNKLTPNLHNLPFQIKWDDNREYKYKNIIKCIQQFLECLKKPKQSWEEIFMNNIRNIEI